MNIVEIIDNCNQEIAYKYKQANESVKMRVIDLVYWSQFYNL